MPFTRDWSSNFTVWETVARLRVPVDNSRVLSPSSPLPYHDRKPQGAADFYFAINATFRFIRLKFGLEDLREYWTDLGRDYLQPVWRRWKEGGLPAVAAYWKAFFDAEPGAEVEVEESAESVTLHVRTCPAIAHLKQHGREIVPEFCQHCYFVSEAAAEQAGLTVRVTGGGGACTQTFHPRENAPAPQDLAAISINRPPEHKIQDPQSKI